MMVFFGVEQSPSEPIVWPIRLRLWFLPLAQVSICITGSKMYSSHSPSRLFLGIRLIRPMHLEIEKP